jgi:hypothetical protein
MANRKFTRIRIEDQEVWRAIPGYHGYEASNFGNVRSLIKKGPKGYPRKEPQLLKPNFSRESGRPSIRIKGKFFFTYTLTLLAFVGPKPEGMECCHYDGNVLNNHLSNIRWDTKLNNAQDSLRLNRITRGEENHLSKLKRSDIIPIRERSANGETHKSIAKDYGVDITAISYIVLGKTWTHIRGPIKPLLLQRGETVKRSKLKEADILEIRTRSSNGEDNIKLGKEFNVNNSTISCIVLRKTWKHIGGPIQHNRMSGRIKLTLAKALEIKIKRSTGSTSDQLSKEYQVTVASINNIIGKRTWKNI